MAAPLTDEVEKQARKTWDIGSNLDVYSRSKSKWYRGIISKTNGPYVTVQYRIESGEVGEKDVHRTDEIIRPVEEQLQDPEVAYYKGKIHEIFKTHDAQYVEYAEQMFGQDQVRGKEKEFYENVCGKYDVTPVPYDPTKEPLLVPGGNPQTQEPPPPQAELARAKNENITLQKHMGGSPNLFESKRLPSPTLGGAELETLRSQVEDLKHLNDSIKSMAYADSLTQKLNKRAFDRDISSANLAPFVKGLASIVVAKFDQVRSLLGRHHANEVLYEIAQQLDAAVEPVSKRFTNKVQIYRVSGDEFAVLVRFTADDVKNADAGFNELLHSIGKVSVYVSKKGDGSYQVAPGVPDQAPEVVCGVYVGGHLANPVNYEVCDNLQRVVHSVADHVSRGAEDETYKRFHDSLPRPNVAIHCGLGRVNDMPPVSCIFGKGDAVDAVRAFIDALAEPEDDSGAVSRAPSFQSIQHDDDLLDDEIDEF